MRVAVGRRLACCRKIALTGMSMREGRTAPPLVNACRFDGRTPAAAAVENGRELRRFGDNDGADMIILLFEGRGPASGRRVSRTQAEIAGKSPFAVASGCEQLRTSPKAASRRQP